MRKEVARLESDLLRIDRSFVREIKVLFSIAEPFCEKLVLDAALEAFPKADAGVSVKHVIEQVAALKLSLRVQCCRPQLQRDLEAAHTFLQSLLEFSRPSLASVATLSPFLKQAVSR
jgi:hypothetical protein